MKEHRLVHAGLVILVVVVATAARCPLPAQCPQQIVPRNYTAGVDGTVFAVQDWDPDGPGPQAPLVVVGGEFTVAGLVPAANVAVYDPATNEWAALGGGVDGPVYSLAALPSGGLIVGGAFEHAGEALVHRIARWDGVSWASLGTGTSASVLALLALPGGDVVAGGWFLGAGGTAANRVARWDGSSWSPLGPGMSDPVVALARLPGGDVVAATNNSGLERWDGTAWSGIGSGIAGGNAFALTVLPNGDLVAGGTFTSAGGNPVDRVARWDGTSWSAMGTLNRVYALEVDASGGLFVAAHETGLRQWRGTSWVPLAPFLPSSFPFFGDHVKTFCFTASGDVYVGGKLPGEDNTKRFDGAVWHAMGTGTRITEYVAAVTFAPTGEPIIQDGADVVWRWDGLSWQSLGSPGNVHSLAVLANGDLFASGSYGGAGLKRWNGTSWSSFGPTSWSVGASMVARRSGGLAVAEPWVGVHLWDGTTWTLAPLNKHINAIAELASGDLVTSSQWSNGSSVDRWDGTAWTAIGSANLQSTRAIVEMPNGDVIAGGQFNFYPNQRYLVRWDGQSWSEFGGGVDGAVNALAVLPTGDLVAGGAFAIAGGVSVDRIARWDGVRWHEFPEGGVADLPWPLPDPGVYCVATAPTGEVFVGGDFDYLGGVGTKNLGHVRSGCAASTESIGVGCSGAGGVDVLVPVQAPWLGSTAVVRATGLPAAAIGLGVFGFSRQVALPLGTIMPQGLPGCELWIAADITVLAVPQMGEFSFSAGIPQALALVGSSFYCQALAVELDLQGQVVALTSSNALRQVIGAY